MNIKKSVRISEPVFLSADNLNYRMTMHADGKYKHEFPILKSDRINTVDNNSGYVLKRKK